MPSRIITARIKWILALVAFFLLTMSLLRLGFYWRYQPPDARFISSAFVLGLRFDLKFVSILGVILLLLTLLSPLDPFRSKGAARFWGLLMPLLWVALLFFYVADFFHFDYLQQRLNASVLNYLEDTSISAGMVLQSYPVVPIISGILVASLLGWVMLGRLLRYFLKTPGGGGRLFPANPVFLILLAGLAFGKFGQYPLRWSDAFNLGDNFSANLALNPLQSFFSTLRFRGSTVDIGKVRASYPLMAEVLGVREPDEKNLNFSRSYVPADTLPETPNVVLVICESFSAYKTGAFGNPLRTTPFFDSLVNHSALYERCFTPAYGTARGVWALITGIPDVEHPKTASRNPAAVDQRTIINDFEGYEHLYFIGGNPAWANIQGLLSNNIRDLRMYMQYDFKSPKIDVWGISDKNLFLESNSILRNEKKPFFAIIQTADNHRPYTIPEEDRKNLDLSPVSSDSLRGFGFESNEQLFAFRYTDYCFNVFMRAAQKEKYFRNTIFVFIGDHGTPGNADRIFTEVWFEHGLTSEHVPLLFYSPGLIEPSRNAGVCSQLDVIPSLAGLARIPYSNHTMGRNLFDTAYAGRPAAFIMDHDIQQIGMIDDDYYFMYNLRTKKEKMVSVRKDNMLRPGHEEEGRRLRELCLGWYETARYMLLNNKKK